MKNLPYKWNKQIEKQTDDVVNNAGEVMQNVPSTSFAN